MPDIKLVEVKDLKAGDTIFQRRRVVKVEPDTDTTMLVVYLDGNERVRLAEYTQVYARHATSPTSG